jgi:NRE family putative nickel resistance protein-like MFS transporter
MPEGNLRRATSVFRVLRTREVRSLWLSDLISDAGSFVTFIALAVYIHRLTGGVAEVGFALGLRSIAGFVFGPFTGVVADRLDRRRVMVACNLGRAVLVAALAFTHAPWEAYVLAFASAILSPLYRSARAALLPRIVPPSDLVPALTVVDTTHHLLHMVGPAFGGLVVFLVGARQGFFVDAASFLISAAFLARIPRTGRPEPSGHSPVREFADGLAALVRAPAVRTYSLVNAALAFSGAGLVALLVVYVRDELGLPDGAFGLVLAVAGLATVAASLVIAVRDDRHPRTPWVFVSALAGGAFALMLLRPGFGLLLLLGAALGLQDGGIDVPSSATTAETLDDRFRGRAAAASEGLGDLFFAAGSIGFALLGDPSRLGVPGAMALAGAVGVVLPLLVLAAGGARAIAERERRRLGIELDSPRTGSPLP